MIRLIGYLLALLIGISLGLLGGGGSVLALPVLVYVMGVNPKSAIAMTLIIVGSVSFLGSLPHLVKGRVPLKQTAIFGAATMIGAYLGAKLATFPFITSTFQMLLFGVAMLVAAGLMIKRTRHTKVNTSQDELEEVKYVKPVCQYCWLWLMTEGVGVGVLTGLVGVGGGFAIVPALVLLGNIPMKQAIGASLLIISFNSVAGLLGYLGHVSFDWPLTITFTLLAGVGTFVGSYLVQFVSAKQLQKGFAYFLLFIAAFVLIKNLT